jgi:hypothetical protein
MFQCSSASSRRSGLRLVTSLKRRRRKGVAAAEAAICLPLLVILTFASIEACDAIFLSHSLNVACYETIRVAVKPKSENTDADAMASNTLADQHVNNATVTYDPPDISNVDRGQPITISISAPVASNSILPSWFFTGRTLGARVTMVKE